MYADFPGFGHFVDQEIWNFIPVASAIAISAIAMPGARIRIKTPVGSIAKVTRLAGGYSDKNDRSDMERAHGSFGSRSERNSRTTSCGTLCRFPVESSRTTIRRTS
jgi:hypothetical protein